MKKSNNWELAEAVELFQGKLEKIKNGSKLWQNRISY